MILAATGHRPDKLGGYSDEAQELLYQFALLSIRKLEPTKVISGMALGWDTAWAQAAIKLKVPLIAAVPFKDQESIWPIHSQKIYNKIISKATVVVVSEGSYAPWKLQVRNKWMVDNSDALVALFDGSSGGTANCVKYAESVNKGVIQVFSKWERFQERANNG